MFAIDRVVYLVVRDMQPEDIRAMFYIIKSRVEEIIRGTQSGQEQMLLSRITKLDKKSFGGSGAEVVILIEILDEEEGGPVYMEYTYYPEMGEEIWIVYQDKRYPTDFYFNHP